MLYSILEVKMDKNTKIILAVIAAVVVVCVCGACATFAILAAFVPAMTTRMVQQNFPEIQIDPAETFQFDFEPGETLEVNPGELLEGLENMFMEDPQEISKLASEIVEFDLPAGYEPAYGFDFNQMKMAGFNAANDKYLLVMQFPPDADLDIQKMMRQMDQGNMWKPNWWGPHMWGSTSREVDRYLMTIRGQVVPVVVSEGGDGLLDPYRSVATAFEGQNGPVLVVAVSPQDAWDQNEIDTLLGSIR